MNTPDGPPQRDGSHSDLLISDSNPQCPRTHFPHRREFDEEELQRRAQAVVSVLHGRTANPARFPTNELLTRLQALKEEADLAIIILSDTQPADVATHDDGIGGADRKRFLAGLEKLLRWIWRDGKADPRIAGIRLGVATRFIVPPLLAHAQQVDLLELFELKDKQALNRHFIDFRDSFEYFDQLMRSDAGRAAMKLSAKERRAKWTATEITTSTSTSNSDVHENEFNHAEA